MIWGAGLYIAGSQEEAIQRVEPAQYLAVRKLGQKFVDRIVESELAFLDQDHRRRSRNRLRH